MTTEDPVPTPKPTGIPGAPPATIENLPEEEKFQLREEDKDGLLYGQIGPTPEERQNQNTESQNFMKAVSEQAGKDLAYYAQFDKYDIEMDDGSTERYYRVSPLDYEWDEIEDLRAEVEGGEAMDDGHKLNKREVRLKTKLLEQLKAKYYLKNAKTQEPMSAEKKAHVKNSSKIGAILDACVVISLHKAVQGKK